MGRGSRKELKYVWSLLYRRRNKINFDFLEDFLNSYEGFSTLIRRFTFIEKLPFKDKGLLQKLQGESRYPMLCSRSQSVIMVLSAMKRKCLNILSFSKQFTKRFDSLM